MSSGEKSLVVYVRSVRCEDQDRVRRDLSEWGIPFHEVNIDQDSAAAERLEEWTGFRAVPTVLIGDSHSGEPYTPPAGIVPGQTPRNLDRGCMISEPLTENLRRFLSNNGFLKPDFTPSLQD